ncbi:hypothetical protein BY458DRAFT_320053 [Sporodiniella umbellata]|nr:hypothetical protein BY458DRAFT_320053 [Sporodiniella umbellata]
MKDVKSTIFLKDVYTQESVILLGTYTSSGGSISYSYHQQKTLNCSLTPMISNPSSPTDEKSCPQSPPLLTKAQRRKTDGQFSLMQEASTIANTSVPNINRHTSCALMRPSKSFEENSGNTTREARQHPIAVPTIPEQPVLSAFLESSAKISQERYNTHAPHEIDQIEPKSPNEDGRHTVFMDSLVLIAEKGCYSNHAPHEIGPQDTICKDSKKKVPELSRYNTESTCSTPGTPQPDSTTVDHLKEIFV